MLNLICLLTNAEFHNLINNLSKAVLHVFSTHVFFHWTNNFFESNCGSVLITVRGV